MSSFTKQAFFCSCSSMRAEHRGVSWHCLVHSLQEAQPLSAAVKDELLPELLQDSVIFDNERRVEAADGFRAAAGREGSLQIKVTKQSAAPSTCKIGLIFLISLSLNNGCFQKKVPPLWYQTPLIPVTSIADEVAAHGTAAHSGGSEMLCTEWHYHPSLHISQNCSAIAGQVHDRLINNELDKNKFTVKRKTSW